MFCPVGGAGMNWPARPLAERKGVPPQAWMALSLVCRALEASLLRAGKVPLPGNLFSCDAQVGGKCQSTLSAGKVCVSWTEVLIQ